MKARKKAFLCIILLLAAGVFYIGYYTYRRMHVVIAEQAEFAVKTEKGQSWEIRADNWMKGYAAQYMQAYLKKDERLSSFTVTSIDLLDEAEGVVLVEFKAEMKAEDAAGFTGWGMTNGHELTGQWVLYMGIKEQMLPDGSLADYCFVKSRSSLAAYNLTIYNTEIQEDTEILSAGTVENRSYSGVSEQYKIENKVLFISYDSGITWQDVPVSYDVLMSGRAEGDVLPKDSYQIGKEMTCLLYGGTETVPLTLMYTADQGISWNISEIRSGLKVRYMYMHFLDPSNGYMVLTYEKANGQEACEVLETGGGPAGFTTVGSGPSERPIKGAVFFDDGLGFFAYPYMEGADSTLYCTRDGGRSFEPVLLPEGVLKEAGPDWNTVYNEAELPYFENGSLYLYVGQSKDRLDAGNNTKALYMSEDEGESWVFIGQE